MTEISKERIHRFALFVFADRITAAGVLLLLFGLLSCRQPERPASELSRGVTDDLGHTVALQSAPQRIVSLAPNITEILFALGADSTITGVTDYCDYPPAARSKRRVGGMLNPNLERVLGLHPDLVLMSGSGNIKADYDKLSSSGVPVFVTFPRTVEDVLASISSIGTLIGRTTAADSLVHHLKEQRDSLLQAYSHQGNHTVLMLLSLHPIVAIGPGTFLHEVLTIAHGQNIAADAPMAYPVLSREEILSRQPDVIIVTNDIVRSTADILKAYPEWKRLRAVQEKRIALVDAAVVSRPGPRVIEGLNAILQAMNPAGR